MKKITVCIGSACHIKGSARVVEQLEKLIEDHHVTDKVELAGIFCTGNCQKGVCTTFEGKLYSLNDQNTEDFFTKEVLSRL